MNSKQRSENLVKLINLLDTMDFSGNYSPDISKKISDLRSQADDLVNDFRDSNLSSAIKALVHDDYLFHYPEDRHLTSEQRLSLLEQVWIDYKRLIGK